MSKSVKSASNCMTASLEQWLQKTIASQGLHVQYRVRGNTLHLLCRKAPCPDRQEMLLWLIPVLQQVDFSQLLPDAPPLYQVWLYGCAANQKSPEWTALLYLNQLDRHLQELQSQVHSLVTAGYAEEPVLSQTLTPRFETTALALSNIALAKRGEEMAIASYLSETLNELGVAVRVSAKVIPYTPPATVQQPDAGFTLMAKRLWVACEAAYSPDPSLLSEPITHKLRELEIEGFHDAVILFQVVGESRPDWALRVDLTPATEMLREWARWGDLEAIQRLLNQDIASLQLQITTATLNATTLHLCCGSKLPHLAAPVIEHHKRAKADIALLLESIAPQGIHAATLYGQLPQQETPAWIEWLDLPATQHAAFADPTIELAKQGDWGAIAFSLHRLLNPDLDEFLATGGIRLQLLPKHDLLHIMCEGSRCPERRQIIPVVVRFLRQLEVAGVAGVRLYGRRSGQKKPLWSYGSDFVVRSRLVPEVTPEFAATENYVADLLPQPDQVTLRPDLTPEDIRNTWQRWQQKVLQKTQQVLLRSQLFTFAPTVTEANALPGESSDIGRKIALVWGTAGVLLLLQSNWLLTQIGHKQPPETKTAAQPTIQISSQIPTPVSPLPSPSSAIKLKSSVQGEDASVFNSSGFTRSGDPDAVAVEADRPSNLPYVPRSQTETLLTAEILAEDSPLPTFNSQQLDQKLQLYYRFLEKHGAPDVLIVGSSRALRGIDPIALQKALKDLGYADDKVFNLGINGATAQVVDLLIQQILTTEQLPRLILWADGARAFNSGTTDVTYNGIVASEAYRQLLAGTLPIPTSEVATVPTPAQPTPINKSLADSYASIDRWLSQKLGEITGHQTDRDRLKQWTQQGLTAFLPSSDPEVLQPVVNAQSGDRVSQILQAGQTLPDETGFLSLGAQFNPATYYQKYARVLGSYDSDYENFQVKGDQENALKALLKFTQASKIPVVFVNLPLTEDYLDPTRLEYEQEFRDYMVKLSLKHPGFIFRDLSEQWTTRYSYFSDPSHLNRYGAYAVANKLAQDVKIPWLRPSERAAAKRTEEES